MGDLRCGVSPGTLRGAGRQQYQRDSSAVKLVEWNSPGQLRAEASRLRARAARAGRAALSRYGRRASPRTAGSVTRVVEFTPAEFETFLAAVASELPRTRLPGAGGMFVRPHNAEGEA